MFCPKERVRPWLKTSRVVFCFVVIFSLLLLVLFQFFVFIAERRHCPVSFTRGDDSHNWNSGGACRTFQLFKSRFVSSKCVHLQKVQNTSFCGSYLLGCWGEKSFSQCVIRLICFFFGGGGGENNFKSRSQNRIWVNFARASSCTFFMGASPRFYTEDES